MALFIVISTMAETTPLDVAIAEKFGNASMKLPRGEWLVAYEGTTKQLSDDLGISEGTLPVTAVVFALAGHWGRASTSIWEWLAKNAVSPR